MASAQILQQDELDARHLVARLYGTINADEFNVTRQRHLVAKLEQLKAQLEPMECVRAQNIANIRVLAPIKKNDFHNCQIDADYLIASVELNALIVSNSTGC